MHVSEGSFGRMGLDSRSVVEENLGVSRTETRTDSAAKAVIGSSDSVLETRSTIEGQTSTAVSMASTAPIKVPAAIKGIPPNAASISFGQAIVKFAKEVFTAFVTAYRKVTNRVDLAKVTDAAIKNVKILQNPESNLAQVPKARSELRRQLELLKTHQKEVPPNDKERSTIIAGAIKTCEKALAQAPPLSCVMGTYNTAYAHKLNKANLEAYGKSDDCKRHAATARIYYNSTQLQGEDALKIVFQREPTNLAMVPGKYNQSALSDLFGYEKGVYNDPDAKKVDGSSFKDRPNTAAVYSETCLWNHIKGDKKEVACLSLPAPALDSPHQPHFSYYVKGGKLDEEKYKAEMEFLFKTVEQAVRDNKDSAFEGNGVKRVVLSKFGQGAFLNSLSPPDKKAANAAYKEQLALFRDRIKDTGLPIVMSEYAPPAEDDIWHKDMIVGDILETAEEGDLIINAWDPHSAPGNGNDGDRSFDGAMGKGTGILLTQTSWLNQNLQSTDSLREVK